jgi:hypothetical protein
MSCNAMHYFRRSCVCQVLYFELMEKKDQQFTFRLSGDVKEALRKVANETGRTLGQVCEALLRHGIREYGEKGKDLIDRDLQRK